MLAASAPSTITDGFSQYLHVCSVLEERLNCRHTVNKARELVGIQTQIDQIQNITERTITTGEGNSVLLIGPQESSKKTIVHNAICNAKKKYGKGVSVITLNGYIHNDIRKALKGICKQLYESGLSDAFDFYMMDDDEDNVDGLASDYIATREGIDIGSEGDGCEVEVNEYGSVAAMLEKVLGALKSGDRRNSEAVAFVLEDIDRFTKQPKQTLLYNLFDCTQTSSVPIVVIGISCSLDCISLFEKRVKSRFSHRVIYTHRSKDYANYLEIVKNVLTLTATKSNGLRKDTVNDWNSSIKTLLGDRMMQLVLKQNYEITCSITKLKLWLLQTLYLMKQRNLPNLNESLFKESHNLLYRDEKLLLLKSLSVLEYSLLISLANCLEKYNLEQVNFEMAYDDYKTFCLGSTSKVTFFEKNISLKAFERLITYKLVFPVESNAVLKEYRSVKLLVQVKDIRDVAKSHPHLSTSIVHWASSAKRN